MKPEFIALIGVLASSTIGATVAFFVAAYKSRIDYAAFERQINIQIEEQERDLLRQRSDRKLDIAYKFAELSQRDTGSATLFLREVAKETAIGFLYLNDDDAKTKIWIRNDANILLGRGSGCDVVLTDIHVSREHCIIHTQDNKPFVLPLNPTNPVKLDSNLIYERSEVTSGSLLEIGPYEFYYFQF